MRLLDTEPMTVLEREGPDAERLKARLANFPLDDISTTVISHEEQTRGWLACLARMQTEEARIRAYVFLKRHLEIYCRIAVLAYDEKAAQIYERLRQQRLHVGTMNLKIAAIALANDATVLTRNTQDFSKIPDLKFEDWTVLRGCLPRVSPCRAAKKSERDKIYFAPTRFLAGILIHGSE